jgi:DegT/DnrJ/EryC1/StrS aminotransferase family
VSRLRAQLDEPFLVLNGDVLTDLNLNQFVNCHRRGNSPLSIATARGALAAVIESGWVTMGDRVRDFEQAFARLHEAEDAVAVGSGYDVTVLGLNYEWTSCGLRSASCSSRSCRNGTRSGNGCR